MGWRFDYNPDGTTVYRVTSSDRIINRLIIFCTTLLMLLFSLCLVAALVEDKRREKKPQQTHHFGVKVEREEPVKPSVEPPHKYKLYIRPGEKRTDYNVERED